jgi:O-acetyl-ADP-ribose deacetylase (regulator of RNase III)
MRELATGAARIILEQGDITQVATDAIVNAANSSLMGGGGVDGAIHRAGGPEILKECTAIVARQGRLPAGQAVITTGGKLPARRVIHTVGPIWRGGTNKEPETLASAYRESLKLAAANGLATIAFPSISTGVYSYPVDQAADIALRAVRDTLASGEAAGVTDVRFVLFDARTLAAYERAMDEMADGDGGSAVRPAPGE